MGITFMMQARMKRLRRITHRIEVLQKENEQLTKELTKAIKEPFEVFNKIANKIANNSADISSLKYRQKNLRRGLPENGKTIGNHLDGFPMVL